MKQLLIHVGPFKTGTSSVQDYFWYNRHAYAEDGLLYPRVGIARNGPGRRHYHLAKEFDAERWGRLVAAIEESPCERALISSERFSVNLSLLKQIAPLLSSLTPTLVIVVRDECDLVRSMYLQIVKGLFYDPEFVGIANFHTKFVQPVSDFPTWWHAARHRFIYARMIQAWIDAFGPENIVFVPYLKERGFEVVTALCETLDLPLHQQVKNRNMSIGPLAARAAVAGAKYGRPIGRLAARVTGKFERLLGNRKRFEIYGANDQEIAAYYLSMNQDLSRRLPEFSRALGLARENQS